MQTVAEVQCQSQQPQHKSVVKNDHLNTPFVNATPKKKQQNGSDGS